MTPSDAEIPLSFPERVGDYDVLVPIARGGMATVYLGRDASGADVAVKLMNDELRVNPQFSEELLEEGKLASLIDHPNVVRLREVGSAGELFLVMDYIEGDTLSNLERRSPGAGLPLGIGLRILFDALAGLDAAHKLRDDSGKRVNLVHRDFSPQNILVGTDGISRLADFGIAKAATRTSFTRTGFVKGKTAYMAPEQARGEALDRRCDIWAAGVIAWEILAGRSLYEGIENEAVLLLQLVSEEPPRLASVRSDIPRQLDDVVASALRRDLPSRCASAGKLLFELKAACGSSGMKVATRRDVGAHVAALVGARIEARREKADRVLASRRPGRDADPPAMMPAAIVAMKSPPRRARWFAGAGAAAAIVAVAAWSSSRPRNHAPVTPVETAAPATAIPPAESASIPESASVAPPVVSATVEQPAPSASMKAPAAPHRANHPAASARPKGAPPLAESPYEPAR